MAISMTVLKWLIVLAVDRLSRRRRGAVFHAAGFLFPIPPTGRTVAGSRRLSASRRACSDHGRWREGHRLARPGRSRAIRSCCSFPATVISSPAASAAFAASSPTAPASSRCPIAVMPARAGSRASRDCCWMPRRPTLSRSARYNADQIVVWGFSLGTGVAVALAADHPVGKLILEAPYTSTADVASSIWLFRAVPVRWLMRDQFRSDRTYRAGHRAAPDHAWRPRSARSRLRWANGCLRWRMSRSSSCASPKAVTKISTITARSKRRDRFIDASERLTAAVVWCMVDAVVIEDTMR